MEIDEDEEDDEDDNENKFHEAYKKRKLDGQKLKENFEGERQKKFKNVSNETMIQTESPFETRTFQAESKLLDVNHNTNITPMDNFHV